MTCASRRIICLTSQPLATKSTDSRSSNSGCVGGWPCPPKSPNEDEIPRPNIEVPEAVDEDSGGQATDAVLGVDQPIGQIKPIRAAIADIQLPHEFRDRGLDDWTTVIKPIASRQHADFTRLDRLGDHRFAFGFLQTLLDRFQILKLLRLVITESP